MTDVNELDFSKGDGLIPAIIQDADSGEVLESFTVLTVDAAPGMAFVHKRQPMMFSLADARRWMDPDNEQFEGMISSDLPMAMDAVPVSTHVNNARHKDARCVDPIGPPVALVRDERS